MNNRLLIICILFLIFPLLGVIFQFFYNNIYLTNWSYLNVFFSVLFSLTFIKRYYKISVTFVKILFISILLQEIMNIHHVVDVDMSSVALSITGVLYKFIIGIVIYYFLLKPALSSEAIIDH
jgi:hypothetical protein